MRGAAWELLSGGKPKFINIDHDTELLLPPNLREWVPEGHLVHFVMDAVGLLDVGEASVNQRGTGSEQYPPRLLLSLLVYCYATGSVLEPPDRAGDL